MKKNMIAAGALLGSALVLSGCQFGLNFGDAEQAVSSYDVTDKVTALDVATGSGEIVISESERSGVHVTETIHWHTNKPTTEHPVDAGTLTLRHKCPEPDMNCSVDYKVEIPRGVSVKLDAGSGTITMRGLTGAVSAVHRIRRSRGQHPGHQAVRRRHRLRRHRGEVHRHARQGRPRDRLRRRHGTAAAGRLQRDRQDRIRRARPLRSPKTPRRPGPSRCRPAPATSRFCSPESIRRLLSGLDDG